MTETTPEQDFTRWRRHGDAAALGRVFDALAPQLLLVAAHLAGGSVAEDLVQATFVDAIEQRARWDGERPLAPWLCGLLVNHVRRELRRRQQAPDPARWLGGEVSTPHGAAEAGELAEFVRAAVARLPRQYHQVVTLRFVHGFGLAQIAQTLRLPLGTVKTRLYRGLAMLKRGLPAGLATAFAALVMPERGLAAVREVVLGHAGAAVGAAAGTTVAATAATGTMLGAVAMQKVVLAVGVVVLVAGGWIAVAAMGHGKVPAAADRVAAPVQAAMTIGESTRPGNDRVEVASAKPEDAASTPAVPGTALPRVYEVGQLLRSPTAKIVEQLALSDELRSYLATAGGLPVAEEEVVLARQQLNDLCECHGDLALHTAKRLLAEGGGRRSAPAELEKDDYSPVFGPDGGIWIARDEAPELFAIKGAIRTMPQQLAASIVRRVAEQRSAPAALGEPTGSLPAVTVMPLSSFYLGVLAPGESVERRIRLDADRPTRWEYLRPEWTWELDPPAGVRCELQVNLLSSTRAEVVVTAIGGPSSASGELQGRVTLRLPETGFRRELHGYGYLRRRQ